MGGDPALAGKLADAKRRLGDITGAVDLFSKAGQDPSEGERYAYQVKALQGQLAGSALPDGVRVAPFIRQEGFLPQDMTNALMEDYYRHQEKLTYAQVASEQGGRYDPGMRNNLELLGRHPVKKHIRQKIKAELNPIAEGLGIPPFTPSLIEVKLRMYRSGEYFRIHHDGNGRRLISFSYLLFKEPQRFEGGELLLFDTDTASQSRSDNFTLIESKNNAIAFFPSAFFHAVLPVKSDPDDFYASRFAINGHIHC
jgi:Rps23 Pro-64 3,4-dihydroxylase Tpa1-like proline 4-hydroxylase